MARLKEAMATSSMSAVGSLVVMYWSAMPGARIILVKMFSYFAASFSTS